MTKHIRTENHLELPEKQAEIDFKQDKDIGYNPYPIYSEYWRRYRLAFVDEQLKALQNQMAEEDYLGVSHPALLDPAIDGVQAEDLG